MQNNDNYVIISLNNFSKQEMRRVFDVCHGCRLCYSLCDSFPTLFDLVDNSKTGELDSVPSSSFKVILRSIQNQTKNDFASF